MSDDKISEGMRDALTKNLERVKELRGRLASQERRISRLEGHRGGSQPAWDDTVARADAVIAAVAMIEIARAQWVPVGGCSKLVPPESETNMLILLKC